MDNIVYDILIIGGGATGLMAASEIGKAENLSCAIISKVHPLRSQSCMAQGGINAALNNNQSEGHDSPEHHAKDTVKGGNSLCDLDSVKFFCEQAPKTVIELENMGMIFNRDENGKIAQRSFGGGLYPRTCFSRDFTGHALLNTLYGEVLRNDIKVFEEYYVYDLIVEDGACKGAVVIDIATGDINEIHAKAVVLATGGASKLFFDSTNAMITTGDGMAMAYRAGCNLKNMEFIQFHPTSYAGEGFLVTEACRGEGGHLINAKGERFMKNYDPERMELSSRDIVSRAIQQEIDEGRDENGHIYLDLTHLDEQIIYSKLPQVYNFLIHSFGLDCTKKPIPVIPAAHYFMGGVKTNTHCKTDIKGLFAAGECSCNGIHGANRLGGNSLMETAVFGKQAGASAVKFAATSVTSESNTNNDIQNQINTLLERKEGIHYSKIKENLQKIMEEYAGIYRTSEGLQAGLNKTLELKDKYKEVTIKCSDLNYNFALVEALELRNMLDIAISVFNAAISREESRGAHHRKDFPNQDDEQFLKHSIISYSSDDSPKISYQKTNG